MQMDCWNPALPPDVFLIQFNGSRQWADSTNRPHPQTLSLLENVWLYQRYTPLVQALALFEWFLMQERELKAPRFLSFSFIIKDQDTDTFRPTIGQRENLSRTQIVCILSDCWVQQAALYPGCLVPWLSEVAATFLQATCRYHSETLKGVHHCLWSIFIRDTSFLEVSIF